jgi:hypothetical protein
LPPADAARTMCGGWVVQRCRFRVHGV